MFTLLSALTLLLLTRQSSENQNGKVASILKVHGDVLVIQGDYKRMSAFNGLKLRSFDRLLVGEESHCEILFESGHQVKVLANSEVYVRLWDTERHQGPIYLHVKRGQVEELKPGAPNALFIEREQAVYPTQHEGRLMPYLKKSETTESKTPVMPQSPETLLPTDSVKLGNEEIRAKVAMYMDQFQRCQLNALRTDPAIEGKMTVGFSILPTGKTESIQVIQSDSKNQQLTLCIKSVFERMDFPEFQGDPVFVSYPLIFQ